MTATNVSVEDLFNIQITISGTTSNLPWTQNQSASLFGRQEIKNLISDGNTHQGIDTYLNLKQRFQQLRDLKNNGATVSINGVEVGTDFDSTLNAWEDQFDEFYSSVVNVRNLQTGILESMIPDAKPARSATGSRASDDIKALKRKRLEAEAQAIDKLIGPDDLALQIGWLKFGPENAGPNIIRLGPDKVTFADFNNVSTVESLRSDTDVAIKGPNGRALMEIDIIFPNVKAINGTTVDDNLNRSGNPGFRDLMAMLRMSPLIPVGGKAVAMALVNQITAQGYYDELRKYYFEQPDREDPELLDRARNDLTKELNISFDALTEIFQNERATYDLINSQLQYDAKKREIQIEEFEQYQGKVPTRQEFVESLKLSSTLIPLVCTSITVSTVRSAVGALRVRLSFQKFYDPYVGGGQLAFYDDNGDGTFDASKAWPLRRGAEIVYLQPRRLRPQKNTQLEYKDNPYYIPAIGDLTLGSKGKTLAGFENGKSNQPRYRINENGFTTYAPVKASLANAEQFSPILFRFAPATDPDQVYEYVPNDMILESVSWFYANKIATFPMDGQIYPGFQHMGRATVNANLKFVTTSQAAIQKFFTVKALMDQQSKHETASELLRHEFVDVYNDILSLSGVNRWIVAAAKFETDPDNPGLYHLQVELTSNMEQVHEREKLSFNTESASPKHMRRFWWWLYAGLLIKWSQNLYGQHKYNGGNPSNLFNSTGIGNAWNQDAWKGNYTNVLKSFLNGDYGFDGTVGANDRFASSFDKHTFGQIGTANGPEGFENIGIGEEASHLQSEVDAIWDLVWGKHNGEQPEGKQYVPGIIDQDMMVAAFLEVIKDGKARIPNATSVDLFPNYTAQEDLSTPLGKTETILQKGLEVSIAGTASSIGGNKKLRTSKGSFSQIAEVDTMIRAIADFYDNRGFDKGDGSRSVTPWWISNPAYEHGGGGTPSWLRQIAEYIDEGADESDHLWNGTIGPNLWHSPAWIPSPAMWDAIYKVMHKWSELYDVGNKERNWGYQVQTSTDGESLIPGLQGVGDDQPAFMISNAMKTLRPQINEIISNPIYRRIFPSFWKKHGLQAKDFANSINPFGNSSFKEDEYVLSEAYFDLNNNYLDLPQPRYFELFSNELVPNQPPVPKVWPPQNGYQVWRKVAPSFLELGIKPDVYNSLSILTTERTASPKTPELMTPRSFFDYCDPGYFYFKRSWLVESYRELLDSIDHKVDSTKELSPTGGDDRSFAMNDREREVFELFRNSRDEETIVIGRADFVLEGITESKAATEKTGQRTTRVRDEVDLKEFSRAFAKMTKKELISQLKSENSIAHNDDLEKLWRLSQKKVDRIMVVDANGRRVGMIVNAKGGDRGTVEFDDLTQLVRNHYRDRDFNKEDTSNFYFVDLSDLVPRTPGEVTYGDHSAVLEHNVYKDEDAKKVYRDTLMNLGDLSTNHLRAYPTFKLYFVREQVSNEGLNTFLEDDMYGYHSVISFDVVLDKEDADTAKIVVTDISGRLSTASFKGDEYTLNDKDEKGNDDETEDTDFGKDGYDRIKLEIGTNILIKMGYGNDPATLKTVFTGSIAEIEPGPITTIIAQSYKTELMRQVNFFSTKEIMGFLMDELLDKKRLSPVGPSYLTFRILRELATMPNVGLHDSAGGIPHFGRFISLSEYLQLGADKQKQTKGIRADDDRDSGRLSWLVSGATIATSGALLALTRGKAWKYAVPMGAVGLAEGTFNFTDTGFSSKALAYLQKYDSEFMQTNAMKNVMYDTEPSKGNWIDHLSKEWLVDSDGWTSLKEVARYNVGHICQVVPYGAAATLFMGRKGQPYHYKPFSMAMRAKYAQAQQFAHFSTFARLYNDVIAKFFASREWGVSTVRTDWRSYLNKGDAQVLSTGSWNNVSLEEWVNQVIGRVKAGNDNDTLDALDIFAALPWISKMETFPSFAISRYIVSALRSNLTVGTTSESAFNEGYAAESLKSIGRTKEKEADAKIKWNGAIEDDVIFFGEDTYIDTSKTDEEIEKYVSGVLQSANHLWLRNVSDANQLSVSIDQIRAANYLDGAQKGAKIYWAFNGEGNLVTADELKNKYLIDPRSGKPTYHVGDALTPIEGYSNAFGARLYFNNAPFLSSQTYYATSYGAGSFRYLNGSAIGFKFHENGRVESVRTVSALPDHMVLFHDKSEELDNIKKYGDQLLKILFATFFGLTWSKNGKDQVEFLGFPKELDSVWKEYTDVIMKGVGADIDNPTDLRDDLLKLYNRLQNHDTGILAPLASTQLKYGDVHAENVRLDPLSLQQAANIFNAEIQEMALRGQIRPEEVDGVQTKFRQFMQLAAAGQLAAAFSDNVDDVQGIVDAAKSFSLETSPNTNSKISTYSNLIDKIMGQVSVDMDPQVREGFTLLIKRDPKIQLFDPLNFDDVTILHSTIRDINLNEDFDESRLLLTKDQQKGLDMIKTKLDLKSLRADNADKTAYAILQAATGNNLNYREIEDLNNLTTPDGIALGLGKDASLYSIMLSNADNYKLFLLFFSKWLKRDSNADDTLRQTRIDNAVRRNVDSILPPDTKRFEDVHYIVSGVDIIENNIVTTMAEMANNILLMTPHELEVINLTDEESPKPLYKLDIHETKYIPYPNYQYNGVDWNPYVRPELRKQRVVIERNAESDHQRLALLINHMADAIRPMYRGHLKIIGRNIKPYDKIVLVDGNKDMFGIIEVERVVHNFHGDTGWTTTIIPHAFVNPMEPSQTLLDQFDTSAITYMLKTINTVDWVLNAWFIGSLILAPFTGGTSAVAGGAVRQGGKAAVKKGFRAWAGNAFKQGWAKVGSAIKSAGQAVNKEGAKGLEEILLAARAGLKGGQFSWSAITKNAVFNTGKQFFTGGRYYTGGVLTNQAVKWAVGMSVNIGTEMRLRSGVLPIHTYCLTRFGRPLQAGLDMHVTSWYSWAERFGQNLSGMTDSIEAFLTDAFKFNISEAPQYSELVKTLEGR